MVFEPTIPAFEQAKTIHASDRAATMMGNFYITFREMNMRGASHYEPECILKLNNKFRLVVSLTNEKRAPVPVGKRLLNHITVSKLNSGDEQWMYEAKCRRETDVCMNYSYVILVTAVKGRGAD